MSAILKALRKIEEDKRVASHSAPDLRMDQGNSARRGWPLLPLVAGIVLGAVCVGLFSFWGSFETPVVVTLPVQQPIGAGVESQQAVQPPVVAAEQMVSVSAEPLTVPVKEQIAASAAEVAKVREVIMPVEAVPVVSGQSETEKQQTAIVAERKSLPEVIAPEIMVTTAPNTPIAEPVAAGLPEAELIAVEPKALPEGVFLEVSEIFYHEDPANSMAVVNDLPVMIGTFVDSAIVQEIHPQKVVFKIDDSAYDVPLTTLQ